MLREAIFKKGGAGIMITEKCYNQNGEEAGEVKLSRKVFDVPWNADLAHQVALSIEANKRNPVAHAKGRGEVRGGGKKPWKQKGLGRARHGSIRSPIWVGGGVTHGPLKEKDYKKKVNRKMGRKALFTGLSQKLREHEILFLDKIDISEKKTKTAKQIIEKLKTINNFSKLGGKGGKALFCFDDYDFNAFLSFRNLPFAAAAETRNLNLLDLLTSKFIILTKESIKGLEEREEKI